MKEIAQKIRVDLAMCSNGIYDRSARIDARRIDCPTFVIDLGIIVEDYEMRIKASSIMHHCIVLSSFVKIIMYLLAYVLK